MTHYLVVAHQTATSPALLSRAKHLATLDRGATFTLLVPATHPKDLLARDGALFTWEEAEAERIARARGAEARAAFEAVGLRVTRTLVGDDSPLLAIEDELRRSDGAYDPLILSTFPPGVSRWLAMDVQREAERLALPVIHVYEGVTEASTHQLLQQRPLTGMIARMLSPVGRLFEGRQPGIRFIVAIMLGYLIIAATLAVWVDRRFFVNDVVALLLFAALLGGLVVAERALSRIPRTSPAPGETPTQRATDPTPQR